MMVVYGLGVRRTGTLRIFDNQLMMGYFDGNSHKYSLMRTVIKNKSHINTNAEVHPLKKHSHIFNAIRRIFRIQICVSKKSGFRRTTPSSKNDGEGINLQLDALPVSRRVTLRKPNEKA
jgi:hypothetical protein